MNNRIVEIRKAKGITRKQLAEIAGVNFRFLESIEQGRLDLYESSYSRVIAIAKALDVKPEELFNPETTDLFDGLNETFVKKLCQGVQLVISDSEDYIIESMSFEKDKTVIITQESIKFEIPRNATIYGKSDCIEIIGDEFRFSIRES